MKREILPSGDTALLVECDSLEEVLALHRGIQRERSTAPVGIVDVVPAARTVLISVRQQTELDGLRAWVERVEPLRAPDEERPAVTIDVQYDGADLAEVAHLTGLTEREVVRVHTASRWQVAFGGFAPGFGYLVTDHRRLEVPRRAEPRTRVPAGSVGLAAEFTGVYPRSSPGGWQLLGTTETMLWDAAADEPALLVPGRGVRFREVP